MHHVSGDKKIVQVFAADRRASGARGGVEATWDEGEFKLAMASRFG